MCILDHAGRQNPAGKGSGLFLRCVSFSWAVRYPSGPFFLLPGAGKGTGIYKKTALFPGFVSPGPAFVLSSVCAREPPFPPALPGPRTKKRVGQARSVRKNAQRRRRGPQKS